MGLVQRAEVIPVDIQKKATQEVGCRACFGRCAVWVGHQERYGGYPHSLIGMMRRDREPIVHDCTERLLQGVSRSFALTIPQLPVGLREPVTNGYLVCRIADTIEDEETLPPEQKRLFFSQFNDVLEGKGSPTQFAQELYPLLSRHTSDAEKELILNTPLVVETHFSFNPPQQAALKRCARIMSEGMQRFQERKSLCGLKDTFELNSYCYHVAGVVGEMLTELFCDYSGEILKHREQLLKLAVSFGQGLQMTNILKDLWDDRQRGACWLPRDVFERVGYHLESLSSETYEEPFGEGLAELIGMARGHLRSALNYTLVIPKQETGIRKFCLWAIGMAVFTLRNINRRRDYRRGSDVKISRKTARSVILASNLVLRNDILIRGLFHATARGLPGSIKGLEGIGIC
jgi:farnesyl-diphosphate farnesyltransferase